MSGDTKNTEMSDNLSVLAYEELALGATLGSFVKEGTKVALAYKNQGEEYTALRHGTGLTDLSGCYSVRLSGPVAQNFIEATCAGQKLGVGECTFEPVLLGDSRIASIPLVARTGDQEYVLWDISASGDILAAWLNFVANINQNGFAPYQRLEMEEVSQSLTPLLLWGEAASEILSDYLKDGSAVPETNQVHDALLDNHIPALIINMRINDQPSLILLVLPQSAPVMFRSLLSFNTLTPVGLTAATQVAAENLEYLAPLSEAKPHEASKHDLMRQGLLRHENDYIGARALTVQE
ncbi:MAG: hypothetical protein ACFNZW_06260 [Coriobacteriaceae bacterium]